MSASEDEFAYFLDPSAAGIDLDLIPGLAPIPPPSQSSVQILGDIPAPTTPLATREDSVHSSTQYSFEDVDAAFLTELDQVEQRLLQSQGAGPSAVREEGPSTFNAEGELTSRYFHGEHTSCVIAMVFLMVDGDRVAC
jgi:hypothetical protein